MLDGPIHRPPPASRPDAADPTPTRPDQTGLGIDRRGAGFRSTKTDDQLPADVISAAAEV